MECLDSTVFRRAAGAGRCGAFLRCVVLAVAVLSVPVCVVAVNPMREYIRQPQDLGLMYRDISPMTRDGYKIKTWFIPAQRAHRADSVDGKAVIRPYRAEYMEARPTIICCNGDEANMSYSPLYFAKIFACEYGFNVVTFDWRGFGQSAKFPINSNYICYTEMLEDYRAVIDAVLMQPATDRSRVAVVGSSTGGSLSMMAVHRSGRIAAFVGRGITTDFDAVVRQLEQYVGRDKSRMRIPLDFPLDEVPIKIAPDFYVPSLFIVGDEDMHTPVWMSEAIMDKMPDGVERRLLVVEGAGHGAGAAPEVVAQDMVIEAIADFLGDLGF